MLLTCDRGRNWNDCSGSEDVDVAVAAAQNAFKTFSQTSVEERLELLNKITEIIGSRSEDLATAITSEMEPRMVWLKQRKPARVYFTSLLPLVGKL